MMECTLALIAELAKRPVAPGDTLYVRTEICEQYTAEQIRAAKQCANEHGVRWRFVGPAKSPECVNDFRKRAR